MDILKIQTFVSAPPLHVHIIIIHTYAELLIYSVLLLGLSQDSTQIDHTLRELVTTLERISSFLLQEVCKVLSRFKFVL